MIWRNQLRDLAILYSLADDLKLFWQVKAMRWEKLRPRVRQAAEGAAGSLLVDEKKVSARFKELLLGDPDYKELRHRIRTAVKEVNAIAAFLDIPAPHGLDAITFKPLLMDYHTIETAVEGIERFIPLCRASSYPYHHFWQALKAPKAFLRSAWRFWRT